MGYGTKGGGGIRPLPPIAKALNPKATLGPATPDNRSPAAMSRRKMYATPRWRQLRAAQLAQAPACAQCGSPASVVDHKAGHVGPGWHLRFWLPEGLQSLCRKCHAAKTMAEQNRRARNTR